MRVNSKGLPHLEQGGRNLFDFFVLSAIRGRYLTHSPRVARQNNPLSFCGSSALRKRYSLQVSGISENARFLHCLGSLGTMRQRAGLF